LIVRDIRGFGFKRVDAIARKVGVPKEFPPRVRAGILDCLDDALDQGHTWVEEADLIERANMTCPPKPSPGYVLDSGSLFRGEANGTQDECGSGDSGAAAG
jgi:ATP-dependent exoDNAse (exonuclease V) alpha subunit